MPASLHLEHVVQREFLLQDPIWLQREISKENHPENEEIINKPLVEVIRRGVAGIWFGLSNRLDAKFRPPDAIAGIQKVLESSQHLLP